MTDVTESFYRQAVTSLTPDTESFDAMRVSMQQELNNMIGLLPDAAARQWEPSATAIPVYDTDQRSSGGGPKRPVEDLVLDERRLEVREASREAYRLLADLPRVAARLAASIEAFDSP